MFWTKFIHLLFGVTFFGGFIASFFYVQLSHKKDDSLLWDFTVKNARRVDYFVFLPMIIVAMISGLRMVHFKSFTFTTPWIVAAYSFLTLVFFLVIISAKNKSNKKIFMAVNVATIIILAVIVHDAVMKKTLLEHFL